MTTCWHYMYLVDQHNPYTIQIQSFRRQLPTLGARLLLASSASLYSVVEVKVGSI